jgi:hypothetical protein
MTDVIHRNPDGSGDIKIAHVVVGDEVELKRRITTLPGTVEADITATKVATQALSAIISASRLAVSEASAAGIKTSVDALAAIISGGRLLVGETNSGSIKTAVEALSAIISASRLAVSETNSGAIKTAVEAVSAIISASKLAVADSAVATKLDTLHTDIATTLAGFLDGLEGYVDGLEGKLDTVIANQLPPSGGWKSGQNSDVDIASENLGSQALTHGAFVFNVNSVAVIWVDASSASPTAGFPVPPGGVSPFIPCTDISQIKVYSTVVNSVVAWMGY